MAETAGHAAGVTPRIAVGVQRSSALRAFRLAVVLPTVGLIAGTLVLRGMGDAAGPGAIWDVVFWAVLIAIVEFLPVPFWRSLRVSIGFPLLMAVAFLYEPGVAGAVALVGSSDPRELRRGVGLLHAAFNRSQIALSVFFASMAFHAVGGSPLEFPGVVPAALLAVVVDYAVNVTFVTIDARLLHFGTVPVVLRKLTIGDPAEFFFSYIGLGFIGVLFARLFDVGWWAVAAFVTPLLLARQMFFRTRALEQAAQQLREREAVLRTLSDRMAEERQDERMQIAGYLHDDLAQMLYQMSLHIDISEKHLQKGDADHVLDELATIRDAKDRTLHLIRALVRDLHRSPLGRRGLPEALESFCADMGKDSGLEFVTDVRDVEMPPPIQLLCYQVAREAITNVVKHAEASTVRLVLEPTPEGARLTVADDGKGFDVDEESPEGHFGLAMMRERAQVSGGSFTVESEQGRGSTVVAEFKTMWLSDSGDPGAPGRPA